VKIAYSTLACPQWSVEEAVTAAVRYGYDAIEWRLADGELIGPETSESMRHRLRDVPIANGIAIACLDTSCRVVQASPKERTETIETAQRMIDLAAYLNAPFVRVFGGSLPDGTTHAAMIAPTAEVLQSIGTYATERNIIVTLETHDSWSDSANVLALIQEVALPSVKVLWDIHHTYRSGETPTQSVSTLGSAIAYMHVKDGRPPLNAAETWELCLLDEGIVPLREAYAALKKNGYDGFISLEWEKKWHPEIAEPEIALPQAVPLLRTDWQQA
jgi:sugar phosphate isomerase/epimerase